MSERSLRHLLGIWTSRLGLSHVRVDLDVVNFDPSVHSADVSCATDYDRARIRVQPWLLNGAPPEDAEFVEDPETVLVHELLHVALRPLRRARALIEDTNNLHRDVERVWLEAWDQREEEVVDRLAVALVKAWRAEA